MKRSLLIAIAALLVLLAGTAVLFLRRGPSATDYRLARGRALLETENFLAALETLRGIPGSSLNRPETHAYRGAAYLRLHLYQAAIEEFEEAAKLSPGSADPRTGLAIAYIQLGRPEKAVQEATQATALDERSADAWITLGRAQWQDRNFAEAEKAALKVRELNPQAQAVSELLLHVYFDAGDAAKFEMELDQSPREDRAVQDLAVRFFLKQGQFTRANALKTRYAKAELEVPIFRTQLALKREPVRTELYPELIRDLARSGRFDEVIDVARNYRGAVPLDLEMAKAYWMTGRRDLAIHAYQRASSRRVHKLSAEVALAAISDDPAHWHEAFRAEHPEQDYFVLAQLEDKLAKATPMVRAFIYRYAGLFDSSFYNKSAEAALQVLDNDPRNFDALMTISTAYQRLVRNDDAIRYIERAHEAYPNSAEVLSRLANLILANQEKDPQKIVNLMQRAVLLEPNNAGYLYNLGWMYDQTGDAARAIDLYQRAIRASPLSFEAMNNLALIYAAEGEPERALPLLKQAIQTDPESEAAYFNIADYYVRRHDWREALQNYDRILQINPVNVAAAVEQGRIHLELGRPEDAIESLNEALEVDAHSFDSYMLLCSAYEKTGHLREAIAAATEAQRIRPDSQEVHTLLDRLNSSVGTNTMTNSGESGE